MSTIPKIRHQVASPVASIEKIFSTIPKNPKIKTEIDGDGDGKVVPRTSWMKTTPAVRKLTSHRKIFHRSSIKFGAVSAPGVRHGAAGRGARQKA